MLNKHINILCLICARGGSKGIPRKNLLTLGGKPLIEWSINIAKNLKYIDKIVVSTDCQEIATISKNLGAEIPFIRPDNLAQDNSPEWSVWQHAISELKRVKQYHCDCLLVLPPTSPFRSIDDINHGFEIFFNNNVDIVISVKKSARNPYFNMVEINDEGYATICKKNKKKIFRRQDAPVVYDMTTVLYIARTDFVEQSGSIFEGRVKKITIPEYRAIDIDTHDDLRFAEYLLNTGVIDENN